MSNNYRHYLDSISDVVLTTRRGDILSLNNIFTEFSVYENIFSHSLSGHIQILDSEGLSNKYHLFGDEKIELYFNTRNKDKMSSKTFIVYKIDDAAPLNESSCLYTLYFTTEEAILNQTLKVSKHMEGNISSMVGGLLDLVETQKNREITPTAYIHDLIIPNMSPFKTITWLSKQAINQDTGNASFVFHETLKGYNFVSIEDLVNQSPGITYTRSNILALEIDDPEYHDKLFKTVENHTANNRIDIIENINNGIYSSRYLNHNIYNKTYEYKDFDRDSIITLEPHKNTNREYSYDDSVGVIMSNSGRSSIATIKENPQSRNSLIAGISQNIARISITGNSGLSSGMTVGYNYPSFSPMINGKPPFDELLSGKRLIIGIRHIVGREGYSQTLELGKDSIQEQL